MIFAAAALAAQVALTPCAIDGVPGQAQCGTYKVWENREAKAGTSDRSVDHRAVGARSEEAARPVLHAVMAAPVMRRRSTRGSSAARFTTARKTRDLVLDRSPRHWQVRRVDVPGAREAGRRRQLRFESVERPGRARLPNAAARRPRICVSTPRPSRSTISKKCARRSATDQSTSTARLTARGSRRYYLHKYPKSLRAVA